MQAIMIQAASCGFGLYQIPPDARPERMSRKGLKRRKDIEGLVESGGPGGENPHGQVYELPSGQLVVRTA